MAWVIDGAHSEIQFSAKHLIISTVRSRFNAFTSTIDADEKTRPPPRSMYTSTPPAW